MMKKTLTILAMFISAALAFTSCKDDRADIQMNFNATIERLGNDGSKVILANERWTYWELGDQISISTDLLTASDKCFGDLVNSNAGTDFEDYNGVFLTTVPEGSQYFLGLFPRSDANVITPEGTGKKGFSAVINLKRTQPLRSDTSFARNVFPMVAWYGGNIYDEPDYKPANLDFHSLGSILRLQLFSSDGNTHVIDSINITSNYQLWGNFEVENYRTADPYLYGTESQKKTLTLSCSNNPTLATMDNNSLHTFYVVIPATKTRNDSVSHHFTVEVWDTEGRHCKRSFSANMRRNGITYLQALNLHEWAIAASSGNGDTYPGIVGNGTAARPFKIYTYDDLNYVRGRFLPSNRVDGKVRINNQVVTRNTQFRIMRSDIVLQPDGASAWGEGIRDFCGVMTYGAGNGTNPGITNNTTQPLFASISDSGTVIGISVKRGSDNFASTYNWSPFCTYNYGEIRNCRLRATTADPIAFSSTAGFAGICVRNYASGRIIGCGCEAPVNPAGSFAGICYTNEGTVRECYIGSPAVITSATNAGGIVYQNSGSIYDSYFACRVSASSTNWGGIAFQNQGRIEHCYASNDGLIITSGTAGGIVNSQNSASAVINYCYSEMPLRGSTIGSIAATLSAGKVVNSFVNDNLVVLTINGSTQIAGGLIGTMSGGEVRNCFAYLNHMSRIDNLGTAGGVIGSYSGGTIFNSYAYEASAASHFFYGTAASTSGISSSYLVGGAQAGVTEKATSQLVSGDGNLLGLLNAGLPSSNSGQDSLRTWHSNGTIPVFSPYTHHE